MVEKQEWKPEGSAKRRSPATPVAPEPGSAPTGDVVEFVPPEADPRLVVALRLLDLGDVRAAREPLRALAADPAADPSSREEAERLLGSHRVDPVAVGVGLFAFALALVLWILARAG